MESAHACSSSPSSPSLPPCCSFSTNWAISHGDLANSITFESSISPIEDSTVSPRNSPLLLTPSEHASGHCDITINFVQKHEIRQVYVRSTARVYEIYYAPSTHSSNEYLCTVRCGLASREDLTDTLEGEDLSNGSNKQLNEESSKSDSNISTCEEDWVEVKVPASSLRGSTNSFLPPNSDNSSGNSKQELYEATAEVNDAEPCTSLILRMLSLQDKGCVYVDEIYVFADPVDSAESDDQHSQMENSTGSSLMAMLVPTLLQLSKTGNSRTHDQSTSNRIQSGREPNVADQKEVNIHDHITAQVPDIISNSDSTSKQNFFPQSSLERSMDHLVSRMSRIEDIILRFEENMVKPIRTIEARLQRVEQQIETITKNSEFSGFPTGTRFYAPEFSCSEKVSSSFYNDSYDNPNVGASGSDERDIPFSKPSNPPDDISSQANGTQFVPGLKVTAPEFSCIESLSSSFHNAGYDKPDVGAFGPDQRDIPFRKSSIAPDEISAQVNGTQFILGLRMTAPEFSNIDNDGETYGSEAEIDTSRDNPIEAAPSKVGDEEIDGSENVIHSATDKRKEALSIDDALASALAGFLSSASINSHQNMETLPVENPPVKAPEFSKVEDGNEAIGSPLSPDITDCIGCIFLSPCNAVSCDEEYVAKEYSNNDDLEKVIDGFQEENWKSGGDDNDQFCEVNNIGFESLDRFGEPVCDDPILDHIVPIDGGVSEDMLQNILDFSRPSLVLDYETPLSDVRFNKSQENSTAISPLEALLPETSGENDPPCVNKSDDGALFIENVEMAGTASCNFHSVDMFNYELQNIDSIINHEESQNPYYPWSSHATPTTSLI